MYTGPACVAQWRQIDELEQESRSFIANALELRLSCTKPCNGLSQAAIWNNVSYCQLGPQEQT